MAAAGPSDRESWRQPILAGPSCHGSGRASGKPVSGPGTRAATRQPLHSLSEFSPQLAKAPSLLPDSRSRARTARKHVFANHPPKFSRGACPDSRNRESGGSLFPGAPSLRPRPGRVRLHGRRRGRRRECGLHHCEGHRDRCGFCSSRVRDLPQNEKKKQK